MNNSSVSVIIPTYNCAKYITESIDSVLAQTHQPSEIWVIDDGSTDNTRALVSSYTDPRIRYVEMPHRGTSATRNTGIDLASGEYLAFLDADDRWCPAMLETQTAIMERDVGLVCSFTNFIRFRDDTGERLPEQFEYYPELTRLPVTRSIGGGALIVEGDAFAQFVRFDEIPAYMQCMLFRRAMIADMRLNESLPRCHDLEFVLRAFLRGKVACTRAVLTEVRRHDTNLTKDTSLMALDKLEALLPLRVYVDTTLRRDALDDRLVKAYIDAATALIRAARRIDGLGQFRRALTIRGSTVRKLKGAARVSYELMASIRAPEPVIMLGAAGSPTPADGAWKTTRRH